MNRIIPDSQKLCVGFLGFMWIRHMIHTRSRLTAREVLLYDSASAGKLCLHLPILTLNLLAAIIIQDCP